MRFLLDLFWTLVSFLTPLRRPQKSDARSQNSGRPTRKPGQVFEVASAPNLGASLSPTGPVSDRNHDSMTDQMTVSPNEISPPNSSENEPTLSEPNGESEESLGNLSGRATKGASWTLIGALFTQILGIARTAALARLLSQNDFGVAAMALTVIGALYTLTNTGVGASVISMPFKTKKALYSYANTIWTMELARGVVVALLLAAMAWPVALFYRDQRLTPILIALTLTPIFSALTNVGLGLQMRRMEFNKTTLHGMLNGFITVVLTVGLAWWTHNYWALVWGQVIGSAGGAALSFAFTSYRPRLNFNINEARRAFDFGKHMFIIGMANYVLSVMDNVIVGRIIGATALGTYVVAYAFCNLPNTFINSIFNTILFPTFASVNRESDPNRINAILERAITMASVVLLVTVTPLVAFAPATVRVIYGVEWASAVGPMRILLVAGFFAGLMALFSTFLIGINRPRIESGAKIFDAIVFLCLIYPFTLWLGIVGAALASCLTSIISLLYRWRIIAPVVPEACQRVPWLIGSALLCFFVTSETAMVLMSLVGSGLNFSSLNLVSILLDQTLPSLGKAWLQLVLGVPLVGIISLGGFVVLQPTARGEVQNILDKVRARLGT